MTDGEGRLAQEGEMAPGQALPGADPPVQAEVVRRRRHLPMTGGKCPRGAQLRYSGGRLAAGQSHGTDIAKPKALDAQTP